MKTSFHQCMGCGRRSLTLFCDNCAPPLTPVAGEGFSSFSDRRWNGVSLASDGHHRDHVAMSPEHRDQSAR